MTVVNYITPQLLGTFRREVERALHGDMTIQDLIRMVRLRQVEGYSILDEGQVIAIALTTIVEYPRCRRIRVLVLAGRGMDEWLEKFVDTLRKRCVNLGLDGIEFCGRRGFGRRLRGLGAQEFTYMVLEVPWDSEQALQ